MSNTLCEGCACSGSVVAEGAGDLGAARAAGAALDGAAGRGAARGAAGVAAEVATLGGEVPDAALAGLRLDVGDIGALDQGALKSVGAHRRSPVRRRVRWPSMRGVPARCWPRRWPIRGFARPHPDTIVRDHVAS